MDHPTAVITTEDDPTPLVLSIARTLRSSVAVPELNKLVGETEGVVGLQSASDAQSATLTFSEAGVHVNHGVPFGAEPVELHLFPEYTVGETADAAGAAAATLLSPPLPDWREAADRFWELNHGSPGFPSRLVIECIDDDTELVLGDGDEVYEIHGDAASLASVLSGQLDSFLFAVGFGLVTVKGSGAHLSAICGAHLKVRFDV